MKKKPEPLLELNPEDSIIPFKLSREQWELLKTDKNFVREDNHFPDIQIEEIPMGERKVWRMREQDFLRLWNRAPFTFHYGRASERDE